MKKVVTLRVFLDSDNDDLGIRTDYKGFDEKTPLQNSLLIASILKIASNQELEKVEGKDR